MRGTTEGFSLIEIVVVLLIIGIIATFGLPRLFQKTVDRRKVFSTRLNAVTQTAWRGAVETQTVHRVVFDIEKGEVRAERASRAGALDSYVAEQYVPVAPSRGMVRFDIDPLLVLRAIIIEGKDESTDRTASWFFIDPDEASQEVTVTVADEKSGGDMSLVLNPFTKMFAEYEGVTKSA